MSEYDGQMRVNDAFAAYVGKVACLVTSELLATTTNSRFWPALMRLKASEQAVLALHYFEGLSVEEIARALGWREGTVKSTLSRGRDSLRRGLNLNSGSMRGEA